MHRNQSGTRGVDRKKQLKNYSKRHQKRIQTQLASDCDTMLSFFDIYDFVATEVKVFNF